MFEDYTFGNILSESGIIAYCIKMYTDSLEEFKANVGFLSFHDANHTNDLANIDRLVNID